MATGDPCCGKCGKVLTDGGPLCRACRPWTNPAPVFEPPFQQCSVRICRVCGREYFEAACEQTHICHDCRLPALREPVPFRWAPWESPEIHRNAMGDLPSVTAPPCSHCRFWRPRVKLVQGPSRMLYDGVTCCDSPEMEHDFSCFQGKGT